jgi:hypothetical protein
MNFLKFKILSGREEQIQSSAQEVTTMLLNVDHIVSIKPIKISRPDHIIDGYWIRTSNNKKYRAVVIPPELEEMLEKPVSGKIKTISFEDNAIQ